MKTIFLDIDGVLNDHEWDDGAMSTRIKYGCVKHLNRIIKETEAKIVLSSAWRYMIHGGAMTLLGFEYLLRTHGVVGARMIGVTCKDEEIRERAYQIKHWIKWWNKQYGRRRVDRGWDKLGAFVDSYVVIDDDPMGMNGTSLKLQLVRTCGTTGLTSADADKAIRILNRTQTKRNGVKK